MQLNAFRMKVLQAQDDVLNSMKESASKDTSECEPWSPCVQIAFERSNCSGQYLARSLDHSWKPWIESWEFFIWMIFMYCWILKVMLFYCRVWSRKRLLSCCFVVKIMCTCWSLSWIQQRRNIQLKWMFIHERYSLTMSTFSFSSN